MDNKRLLIATVLCFLLLVGHQVLAERMGWIQRPVPAPVPSEESLLTDQASGQDSTVLAPQSSSPRFAPSPGREIVVDTPNYTAVLHSSGAVLKSFVLKHYNDVVGPAAQPLNLISPLAASVSPMGLLINGQPSWSLGEWQAEGDSMQLSAGEQGVLSFTGKVGEILVQRTLRFDADTYLIHEDTRLENLAAPTSVRLSYTLSSTPTSSSSNSTDVMSMVWSNNGSMSTEDSQKKLINEGVLKNGNMLWSGIMSNYFLSAVLPVEGGESVFKGRVSDEGIWRAALEMQDISLGSIPVSSQADWWLGPKDQDLLKNAPNRLSDAVNMGWFKIIALPMLWLMNFFHGFVDNWGVAILLLTLCIKIIFWPLTRKSYRSMEKMKRIQPMMKALQDKHGDNKEAMSREMMQLYKTYGVSPMSGCLPILIQMPVFIALYQALLHAIVLRHASFITYLPFTDKLWLADLSVKDPFYITPIIMGATMFLQQWLSPAAGDPTQRKVMMFMPLIFTFMFVNFPAGLVLYWLCNNVLSIIQQWWTLRKV